ncbi:hypothetical protein GGH95_005961 [Coemansia sp. RSA 1836]|nr:hypothetical protein GGH95_005961 [Coemansia sp. RSA 1836]
MGTVGIYAILSANNISSMLSQVDVHVHPRLLMIASIAFMCAPTLVAKSLGETLFVSIIGTATSIIVTVVVVAMACVYPIKSGSIHVGSTIVGVGPALHFAAIPSGFAMSLSSVSFAYIGTTIVPHIEGGMRRPESFAKVFGAAIALISALYVAMATTGYWAYGSHTLSPITLNFPKSK